VAEPSSVNPQTPRDVGCLSESSPPTAATEHSSGHGSKGSADLTIESLEPLLSAGDWQRITALLGPTEKASQLSPALALVYALAKHETPSEPQGETDIRELAIRSVGSLLAVDPSSATAVLFAKRLLRRTPQSWKRRPAPRATVSMAILGAALTIGTMSGWLLSSSSFSTPWHRLLALLAHSG